MNKPSWLEQNPCDYYNLNHYDDAVELLLRVNKKLIKVGDDIGQKTDSKDAQIVYKRDGFFLEAVEINDLGLQVGMKYSPFQILTRFRFQNNQKASFVWVGMNYMDMDFPYIRVGIKYFKEISKFDRFNIERLQLEPWSKDEIKQDYGKDMLTRVTNFDGFVIEPNNEEHSKVIRNYYNLYAPFPHSVKEYDLKDESKIKWSMTLMNHIFGEHINQGLKYLKILFENPKQPMPILVLVSNERQTGKSTFVDWLSIIFGDNMVIINPQDIGSSFNSSYATKNVIAIEESRFDSVQSTEKLKALATQKTLLVNTKFVNPYNVPFYGKLIITSNDEHKFSKVDEEEIRYWVRKIPTLSGKANHNILGDLTDEIPYFLYYLSQLEDVDLSKSRQVFTKDEIKTEALKQVQEASKDWLQKDIEIYLDDFCSNNPQYKELHFTPIDLKAKFFSHDGKAQLNYIRKIVKEKMKLESPGNSRYTNHLLKNPMDSKDKGRFYIFPNPYYEEDNLTDNLKIESDYETPDGIDF